MTPREILIAVLAMEIGALLAAGEPGLAAALACLATVWIGCGPAPRRAEGR